MNPTTKLGLAASLLLALLAQHASAVDATSNPELISKLITSNSQLDRLSLLGSNEDWFFDFTTQQPNYNFAPGGVVNMNAATFPAAKGNDMTRESPCPDNLALLISPQPIVQKKKKKKKHRLTPAPSGHAEPGPLLHAADALPRARGELRRRRQGQHDDVHVGGERRAAGDGGPGPGPGDDFPEGFGAHDGEHGCVFCSVLPWFFV